MDDVKVIWVYITTGTMEEAEKIGRVLVERRLAACANLLGGMGSIYWWEGKVQQDNEVALIVKTREALLPGVVQAVKELHSYECPCVVAMPILGGHSAYLDWLVAETARADVTGCTAGQTG